MQTNDNFHDLARLVGGHKLLVQALSFSPQPIESGTFGRFLDGAFGNDFTAYARFVPAIFPRVF